MEEPADSVPVSPESEGRITAAATTFLEGAIERLGQTHVLETWRHHGRSAWIDWYTLDSVLGEDYGAELAAILATEIPRLSTEALTFPDYRRAGEYPKALLRGFIALSIVRTGMGGQLQPDQEGLRAGPQRDAGRRIPAGAVSSPVDGPAPRPDGGHAILRVVSCSLARHDAWFVKRWPGSFRETE